MPWFALMMIFYLFLFNSNILRQSLGKGTLHKSTTISRESVQSYVFDMASEEYVSPNDTI